MYTQNQIIVNHSHQLKHMKIITFSFKKLDNVLQVVEINITLHHKELYAPKTNIVNKMNFTNMHQLIQKIMNVYNHVMENMLLLKLQELLIMNYIVQKIQHV